MLQAAVFSLCVFPDDHDIHVTVPRSDARQRLAVNHVSIQVKSGPAVTRYMRINRDKAFQEKTVAEEDSP